MAIVDVAVAVGGAVGLGTGTAALIGGGALMGAGAGGLYGALTGGSIGKDALLGGLLGGGGAYGATALGAGAAGGAAQSALAAPMIQGGIFGSATGAVAPTTGLGVGNAAIADVSSQIAPNINSMVNAPGADLTQVSQSLQDTYGMTPNQAQAAINQSMVNPTGTTGGINMATANADDKAAGIASTIGPSTLGSSPAAGGIPTWAKYGAGALGLGALMQNGNKKYGTLSQSQIQQLPLQYQSNFGTYKPLDTSVMRPMGAPNGPYTGTPYGAPGYIGSPVGYAAGGIADANPVQNPSIGSVEQMSRDNAVGQNQMFPQANINSPAFSSATNTPMGNNMIAPAGDTNVDPYTGAEKFAEGGATGFYAQGGMSHLGSYAAGGNPRLLKGPGDGISDSIPAVIGDKQPARLADGEFVLPSRIVSEIGNGSTEAGARKLHAMMDRVQSARKKSIGKGKFAKDGKAAKELDKL